MALRWQISLSVAALCTLLTGGFSANMVQAQCQHRGGMGMRGGTANPLALQMLMQQQLLQQRQLLQQVQLQQQQRLQAKILQGQVRELSGQEPEAIKAALKAPQAEKRWAAALVVGESQPALAGELIPLVTDDNPFVRQAARQGLVRLSTNMGEGDGKPGKGRRVDFGPAPGSNRVAQRISARKWRAWFGLEQKQLVERKDLALPKAAAAPPRKVAVEEDAVRLGKQLVGAPADQRQAVLEKLRDRKGVAYTQALAESVPQLKGEAKAAAREALAERMARMTAATLSAKLRDDDPEVRRAAALACAMKEMATHIPDLISLLEDSDAAVPPAARAALKSLTSQDFGAVTSRNRDGQARVASAWKTWWQKQGGQ